MLAGGGLSSMTSPAALAYVEAILVGVDNINTGLAGIIGELPEHGAPDSVASAVRQAWAQANDT